MVRSIVIHRFWPMLNCVRWTVNACSQCCALPHGATLRPFGRAGGEPGGGGSPPKVNNSTLAKIGGLLLTEPSEAISKVFVPWTRSPTLTGKEKPIDS